MNEMVCPLSMVLSCILGVWGMSDGEDLATSFAEMASNEATPVSG